MSEPRPSIRVKHSVARRAEFCCEYCRSQEQYSPDSFSVEHIVPRSGGGNNQEENLAFSCQGCNNHKFTTIAAHDPLTGELVPLYHPRQNRWREHFAWNEDFTRIIGLTPTGRATVEKLRLNRPGVVNLRHALHQLNRHPLPENRAL